MNRIWIETTKAHVNETVKVAGWVHRIKKLKAVVFVILRDRTGLLQLALAPEQFENLRLETVIEATGKVVESPNKYGMYELQVTNMRILSKVSEELPIAINQKQLNHQLETQLNHRVLSLRHQSNQLMLKVQNSLVTSFRAFLAQEGFAEIRTPKLVKEGAEGGSNVFSLDYFNQTAYLAQSPQFYKQMMVIAGCERVFEVGPVFRAEQHSTSRHLNEYTSMDLEMGFIEDETVLMALENRLLLEMIKNVKLCMGTQLEEMQIHLPEVPKSIPCMALEEAIEILKTQYGKTHLEGDLDPEGEKLICEHVLKTSGSEFVFLTHYPQKKRPMYTMPCGESKTRSFDLLFRGLEITTGGLRIHNLDVLKESMVKKGLQPEAYTSYLEAFRYGAPPHGGLAIGLERLTAMLMGFDNVRQATLFPRDINRLIP